MTIELNGWAGSAADCAEFGAMLGLDGPVAPAVFAKAVNDPDYARNLILCREAPAFRDFLIAQAVASAPPADRPAGEHGDLELAAKAAKSFWEWTRSGFATLTADEYAARFAACLACPNLVAAPERLIYRLAGAEGAADRQRVCALCGCVAARKAKFPHEHCPGVDPTRPGYNRWGQALPS